MLGCCTSVIRQPLFRVKYYMCTDATVLLILARAFTQERPMSPVNWRYRVLLMIYIHGHVDVMGLDIQKTSCIALCEKYLYYATLTHRGRVTHICVSELTIVGSDNGLSPGRRQAIIWSNAGILLIRTLGTNFSEILGEILSFSFSKMHLKISCAKWRLFGLGLNELMT